MGKLLSFFLLLLLTFSPVNFSAAQTVSFRVISPNAGCYPIGTVLPVYWENPPATYDFVALTYKLVTEGEPASFISNPSQWVIVSGLASTTPYYHWQVPTSLAPGQYRIWAEAYNSAGRVFIDSTDNPIEFSATNCQTGSLAAPTNLAAQLMPGTNQVQLSWTDNSSEENSFQIFRRISPATAFTQLNSVGTNISTFVDTSITVSGVYEYQVKAVNTSNSTYSPFSNIASVSVSFTGSDVAPPAQVTSLAVQEVLPTGVILKWFAPGDDGMTGIAHDYVFKHSQWPINSDVSWIGAVNMASGTLVPIYAGSQQTLTVSGLTPGQTYYFAMKSHDEAGNPSPISNTVFATIPGNEYSNSTTTNQVLYLTGVRAEAVSTSSVVIRWFTNMPSESAVQTGLNSGIYNLSPVATRCDAGGFVTDHCMWLTGLNPSISYHYRVSSWLQGQPAVYSGDFYFVTLSFSGATATTTVSLPAPVQFLAVAESANRIKLSWQQPYVSGGVTGAPLVAGYYIKRNGIFLATTSQLTYSDSNLLANTIYNYSIAAHDSSMNYSPVISVSAKTLFDTTSTTTAAAVFLQGTVLGPDERPVANALARLVSLSSGQAFESKTDSSGIFGITVFAGEYMAEIFPPSYSYVFIRPEPRKIVFSSGGNKSETFRFYAVQKTISGSVMFSDNKPVLGAEVVAYNGTNGSWVSSPVSASGSYSLRVGPGTWKVKIRPTNSTSVNWRWEGIEKEVVFSSFSEAESRTENFSLAASFARLTVRVLDPFGKPMQGMGVIIDEAKAGEAASLNYSGPVSVSSTDNSGVVSLQVPLRDFYIRVSNSPANFISPDKVFVSLLSGGEKTVDMRFKQKDVHIAGSVKLESGQAAAGAFVWGWSEQGQSVQLKTDNEGKFFIPVGRLSRWTIGAGKNDDFYNYRSGDVSLLINDIAVNTELVLIRTEQSILKSVEMVRPASDAVVAEIQSGAKIILPPASAASNGNITLSVRPTVEVPNQPLAKVIGQAYDIEVKDQRGKNISQLENEIEIIFPYDDLTLSSFKVSVHQLAPSYFDESKGSWIKLDTYFADTKNKKIVAKARHLTRFALVAPADSSPPEAPKNQKAQKISAGVRLTWVNPSTDFDHVRVYRSLKKGTLGAVLFSNVRVSTVIDAVAKSLKYYYSVRSVDAAGNESANTNQVSISNLGTQTGLLSRNLKLGMSGDDVAVLQQLLIDEDVYAEKMVTGYFGSKTRRAVSRFQEKYAKEVLAPSGFDSGTGYVGAYTRAKINELLNK